MTRPVTVTFLGGVVTNLCNRKLIDISYKLANGYTVTKFSQKYRYIEKGKNAPSIMYIYTLPCNHVTIYINKSYFIIIIKGLAYRRAVTKPVTKPVTKFGLLPLKPESAILIHTTHNLLACTFYQKQQEVSHEVR